MTTTINASNSGSGGLIQTADASGILALQTAGTTAVTINATQALGVGSTPSYGTSGQVLISAGSAAAPTWGSALVSGTAVASTSGTSIDFTSIPSWVKRITVMFAGVSTNGSNSLRIQIGAGSVETSGYVGNSSLIATLSVSTALTSSAGFDFNASGPLASAAATGSVVLLSIGSNQWIASGWLGYDATTQSESINGRKTTSSTLDRVRITTIGSTDTFDAGTINILYE